MGHVVAAFAAPKRSVVSAHIRFSCAVATGVSWRLRVVLCCGTRGRWGIPHGGPHAPEVRRALDNPPPPIRKGGRGGLGPKSLCTKKGPTRFLRFRISLFPTMVPLVGGGGGLLLLRCTANTSHPHTRGERERNAATTKTAAKGSILLRDFCSVLRSAMYCTCDNSTAQPPHSPPFPRAPQPKAFGSHTALPAHPAPDGECFFEH